MSIFSSTQQRISLEHPNEPLLICALNKPGQMGRAKRRPSDLSGRRALRRLAASRRYPSRVWAMPRPWCRARVLVASATRRPAWHATPIYFPTIF